ncbi:hypothetical protein [Okibacterium endophyticum]
MQIGKQRGSFDLMRSDGPANALTNVWAFNAATLDVLEREIQSWSYLVSRFRSDGAALQLGKSRTMTLPADALIDVVYDAPTSDRDRQWRSNIFAVAQEAWQLGSITPHSLDEFHARVAVLTD